MMDLQTISDEISRLETQKPSYGVCAKLADLYIVKENLMKKQGGSQYANYGRGRENYENYARGRENYERENYARGGGQGGSNYMYDDYNYRMMEDDMGMGMEMGRSPRMSMPTIR